MTGSPTLSTTQIPVINFSEFRQGDAVTRYRIAQQIYHACHEIGFMYLSQPGLPEQLLSETFAQSQRFFSLPLEIKEQISWQPTNRGYVAPERQQLDPERPGDYKEALDLGSDRNTAQPNQWPQDLDGFQQQIESFCAACEDLTAEVLRSFALALDLPEGFFAERHTQQNYTLRLLHYPPLTQSLKPNQIRTGDHTDWGSVTLLFQDQVGGLEVLTRLGEWVPATPIPGTVLVNIGDLMQRWTNHEFCSNAHRVVMPTQAHAQTSRDSIVFFGGPDAEAEIQCVPTCQGADRPPLYPAITTRDYYRSRIEATFGS